MSRTPKPELAEPSSSSTEHVSCRVASAFGAILVRSASTVREPVPDRIDTMTLARVFEPEPADSPAS